MKKAPPKRGLDLMRLLRSGRPVYIIPPMRPIIDQMQADIGPKGSIVSWHASFEKTQNREMGGWFPDWAPFLNDLNERMVDLEDVLKMAYVDVRFDGSTSIKKVLPVVFPALGYKDSAMDAT